MLLLWVGVWRCHLVIPPPTHTRKTTGGSLESIARAKAGILKTGVPLVLAPQPHASAQALVLDAAVSLQCPVYNAGELAQWHSTEVCDNAAVRNVGSKKYMYHCEHSHCTSSLGTAWCDTRA